MLNPPCALPTNFTNAPALLSPTAVVYTLGGQWLLGTNYAPPGVGVDLALLEFLAKTGRVVFQLLLTPPHHHAEKIVEEAFDIIRQSIPLEAADLPLFFVCGPGRARGLEV